MITLYGGPSQIDTWDMKPDAPIEIRGEYQPIRTGIPGRRVCEHLPQFARILDRLAIVRSVHHNLGNHNTAMYETLVGRPSTRGGTLLPPSRMQDFPGYGAAISQLTASGFLPPTKHPKINIALPHVMRNGNDLAGQNAGFLGAAHDPLQIVDDPNQAAFRLRNLEPPPGSAPLKKATLPALPVPTSPTFTNAPLNFSAAIPFAKPSRSPRNPVPPVNATDVINLAKACSWPDAWSNPASASST